MFDKRIFNRYFIINLSVLLLFPSSLIFKNGFDFIKEGNLFLSLIVLFFAKYIRSYSIENFLIDFCFYAKILTFCFLVTINRGVSLWFLFACFGLIYMIIIDYSSKIFNIVLWLLLELPEYCGQSKMYELENSEDFQNFIQPKGSMKNYKIIEFYSPRTINCINTKSIWAEFSLKYCCEKFLFGRIDIKYLDVETIKKYNINNEGFNRTLPIILMFDKDKEVMRFPPYEEKGNKKAKYDQKILRYNMKALEKYFDFEKKYKEINE